MIRLSQHDYPFHHQEKEKETGYFVAGLTRPTASKKENAVFEGRVVKKSRFVFLELCELKNYSSTGTQSKATGLLRLTRARADSHLAGSGDHDIQRHQHEPDDGD